MEDYCGLRNKGKAAKNADLQEEEEEELWRAVQHARETPSQKVKTIASSSSSSAWPLLRKAVPRDRSTRNRGGVDEKHFSSTVPLKIPEWRSKKGEDDEGEDDDDGGVVPPHEYIARRLARRAHQVASFSMCEGVGGTLKGRDLSKLRNAILTKTGFLEG